MIRQNRKSNVGRRLVILLGLAILFVLLVSSIALAQGPEPPVPDQNDPSVAPLGWGDDGKLEVGVEWINDFPGTVNDRSHWDESCDRFYNKLRGKGWTGVFRFTDWGAWEKDWKRSARGGWENSYPDNVDIAMLCTHGSSAWDNNFWAGGNKYLTSVYFGSTHDDHHLQPSDVYHAYGDKDGEWFAFDCCSVLKDRSYWAASMNGLHLLLGFRNTMYVISTGDGSKWADYMLGYKPSWWPFGWWRSPRKVAQAWFEAVDDLQPGGVCARVLAERTCHFDDYLHGRGGPACGDVVDNTYHWRDHCSCTPPPLQLDKEVLAQIVTLPVYEVVDRTVDEAYVLEIASAFPELTGGGIYSDTEYYYMINATGVDTYTLEVDRTTGGYKYRNVSDLGASPVETPTLLSEAQALDTANVFFAGDGADLPGVYHTGGSTYVLEEEVTTQEMDIGTGILQEQEISRMPLHQALSYGRVLSAPVGIRTVSGKLEPMQTMLSIVGPGGRTKIYLGELGAILGVQGGMRDILDTGEQVTIWNADKAWDEYLQDPFIALAQIPWVADVISRTGETLGYYEQPYAQGQAELIPSWIFSATFSAGGQVLAEGVLVYVPASADYLAPEVSITAPTAGAEFESGELVTFSGSVVQYGEAPFTYTWSSNYGGVLGSGATIQAPLAAAIVKGGVISHTISLQVTDANGQEGAASTMVFVKAAIYLPLVLRNW